MPATAGGPAPSLTTAIDVPYGFGYLAPGYRVTVRGNQEYPLNKPPTWPSAMVMADKRASERLQHTIQVKLVTEERQLHACTVDVSPGGMQVALTSVLLPGTIVFGTMMFDGEELIFHAEVRWARSLQGCGPAGLRVSRLGLRFLSPPPEEYYTKLLCLWDRKKRDLSNMAHVAKLGADGRV